MTPMGPTQRSAGRETSRRPPFSHEVRDRINRSIELNPDREEKRRLINPTNAGIHRRSQRTRCTGLMITKIQDESVINGENTIGFEGQTHPTNADINDVGVHPWIAFGLLRLREIKPYRPRTRENDSLELALICSVSLAHNRDTPLSNNRSDRPAAPSWQHSDGQDHETQKTHHTKKGGDGCAPQGRQAVIDRISGQNTLIRHTLIKLVELTSTLPKPTQGNKLVV